MSALDQAKELVCSPRSPETVFIPKSRKTPPSEEIIKTKPKLLVSRFPTFNPPPRCLCCCCVASVFLFYFQCLIQTKSCAVASSTALPRRIDTNTTTKSPVVDPPETDNPDEADL